MHEPNLGMLLAAVLHDLNNPLNAAQFHLQRYMTMPKPHPRIFHEGSAEALNSSLRALNRASRLCQDGARLAALLCGQKLLLHPESCSVLGTLRIIESEAPALVERLDWVTFTTDARLMADPLCLYRVLANLLSNARNYGGPHVWVTVRALDEVDISTLPACPLSQQREQAVLVIVSDDGAGIPDNFRGDLFRPFARPMHRERPGVGLGLWLSRELVRAHGGELWLADGLGAVFCSLWPLGPEPPHSLGPRDFPRLQRHRPPPVPTIEIPPGTSLEDAERQIILTALMHCKDSKRMAAKYLGITRRTLYNKLREYGL